MRDESATPSIRALVDCGDRVTPVFRKTDTIMLGADAFSRAKDIESALYRELPGLLAERDQLEEWLRFYSDDGVDVDYMLGNWRRQRGL